MKKIGTLALSLALAGSLAVPALAGGSDAPEREGLLIAPNPNAGYSTALILNGEALDTAAIPAAPGEGLIPMRLVAESDHGAAGWYPEEGTGAFFLEGAYITVTFATGEIAVNDTVVEDASAVVRAGVTFLPAGVVDALEGYDVQVGADGIEITTPNNDPMVKAAYQIMDVGNMAYGTRADAETLTEGYQIPADQFEQIVAFFPMITSPDTVVIGKLKQGADLQTVKDALETYRQGQESTFSWYLSHQLPKVEDARLVVEGDYVIFLIAEEADAGVEAFRAFVNGQ